MSESDELLPYFLNKVLPDEAFAVLRVPGRSGPGCGMDGAATVKPEKNKQTKKRSGFVGLAHQILSLDPSDQRPCPPPPPFFFENEFLKTVFSVDYRILF